MTPTDLRALAEAKVKRDLRDSSYSPGANHHLLDALLAVLPESTREEMAQLLRGDE